METRIKDGNLRDFVAENLLARADAFELRAVVQRRERDQVFDLLFHFGRDVHGLRERRAALCDAVADRIDFLHALHGADLGVHQRLDDLVEGLDMGL